MPGQNGAFKLRAVKMVIWSSPGGHEMESLSIIPTGFKLITWHRLPMILIRIIDRSEGLAIINNTQDFKMDLYYHYPMTFKLLEGIADFLSTHVQMSTVPSERRTDWRDGRLLRWEQTSSFWFNEGRKQVIDVCSSYYAVHFGGGDGPAHSGWNHVYIKPRPLKQFSRTNSITMKKETYSRCSKERSSISDSKSSRAFNSALLQCTIRSE